MSFSNDAQLFDANFLWSSLCGAPRSNRDIFASKAQRSLVRLSLKWTRQIAPFVFPGKYQNDLFFSGEREFERTSEFRWKALRA